MTVSALVVDIPFGSPFPTSARIWMNSADYNERLQSIQGKDMYMMGLRFDDYSQSASYWDRFENDFGTPYLDSKVEFEEIASFYLIINKVIGFVMVFLGIVMMLVGILNSNRAAGESINLNIIVVDGSYDELGTVNLRGDNPRNKNEIAVGINVAKKLNKELGDMVEVYLEGNKHTLTVTGIYQAISNMSYSARVTADVLETYHPNYENLEVCFINLVDASQSDPFVIELNAKYKDSLSALTQQTLLDSVFKEASAILILPMSLMGLLFLLVTFIIIYSTCRISIKKESKTYGIYKSIGMTSYRIRVSVTLGIAALSAAGALIGIFVGLNILPPILENVLSNYGIVKLPLVLNPGGIAIAALASICSAVIGSWLSSRVIDKTSPRILVVD